ncbi:hypothetical protein [Qipengyuania flava]|uniref:hypothetical protein n=1 Tax=Qipengyuania flava TaxID=192812 RepID=UPI0012FD8AA2|nr:hypothetical protein [Qipengyuania flava]
MTTTKNTPARVGRERTCTQCRTTYRSPRNSSRYCSNACRMKAKRGTAPKADPKGGPDGFSIITKALLIAGFVGPITRASSKAQPVYALTVPFEHALDELSFQFNRKGWGYVSRAEFTEALRVDGIEDFHARSVEAVDLNRRQTRRRMERARA